MARKVQKLFKTPDELMSGYFTSTQNEKGEISKQSIKLRAKKLAKSISLYLDLYQDGSRSYEFLKIYLNVETSQKVKSENLKLLDIAKTITSQRFLDNKKVGAGIQTAKSKVNLIKYVILLADDALKQSGNKHGYYYTLLSLAKHLELCFSANATLQQINKQFLLTFIEYLKTAKNFNYKRTGGKKDKDVFLSQNTQHNLFKKLNYVISKAVKAKLISSNPKDLLENSEKPKEKGGTREFLTIEEVQALIDTPCKNETLKCAFIFCCLVGLRFGDISTIRWKNIDKDNKGDMMLRFEMEEVERLNNIYLSDEAIQWLPDKGECSDEDVIFKLAKNDSINRQLKKWVANAGITKRITFHCSRHTAGTLNLSLGTPIEVVSKLMGHKKIATTQIYAKIVDESQKQAVAKQNGVFKK